MSSKALPKSTPPTKGKQNPPPKVNQSPTGNLASSTNQSQKKLTPQAATATPRPNKLTPAERREMAQKAALQRERQTAMRNVGILVAIFLVVGVGATLFALREVFKPPLVGEEVPMQPSHPHLPYPEYPHPTYTTDPPTSGPHFDSLPRWAVYTEPITKELQVHGLEDGAVIVNYKPGLDQATVDRLAAMVGSYNAIPEPAYPTDPNAALPRFMDRVVMAPYPNLSNNIVLTAWQHIARFDSFDEGKIKRFIDEYAGIDRHAVSAAGPEIEGMPTRAPSP